MPGFHPITFTFSKNSNYGRESLLKVQRQNIAGRCQQTFENKKFADITQQCFALLHQVNFSTKNLSFTEGEDDGIKSRLSSQTFSTLSNTFRTKFSKSSHCELRERLENHARARHFIQLRFQCSAISWLPEGFSFRTKQA